MKNNVTHKNYYLEWNVYAKDNQEIQGWVQWEKDTILSMKDHDEIVDTFIKE